MLSSVAPHGRVAEPRSLSVSVLQTVRRSLVSVSVFRTARRSFVSDSVVQTAPRPFASVSVLRPSRQPLPPFFRLAWLVLALSPPAFAQPPPTVTTVERIVAVVDGRPLLLSDQQAMERVRGLSRRSRLSRRVIDERLMYLEASRLPQAVVLAEEEQRTAQELLERRPSLRDSVSAEDLHRIVRRQIAILKYVEFRFRPQLRVSDQDVRAAFEADPAAGGSWEAAKQGIRERLERRALDERVEAWVRELRARADVRYVGRSAPAEVP